MNESSIDANEQDGLSVTAFLNFTAPGSSNVQSIAVVATVQGQVNDSAVDYTLDFSPVIVSVGNGGPFSVSLADMSFNDDPDFDSRPRAISDQM